LSIKSKRQEFLFHLKGFLGVLPASISCYRYSYSLAFKRLNIANGYARFARLLDFSFLRSAFYGKVSFINNII